MAAWTVAEVAVDKTAYHFDKLYSYTVPVEMSAALQPGMRVLIPFGGGNRRRQGMVMRLAAAGGTEKLKPLLSLLDREPVLDSGLLRLVEYLRETTFCTYYEAIRTVLPGGIGYRVEESYRPAGDVPVQPDAEEAAVLALFAARKNRPIPAAGLEELIPGAAALAAQMAGKGLLIREQSARRRVGDETLRMVRLSGEAPAAGRKYTTKQQAVLDFLSTVETASVKEITYYTGVTESVLNTLAARGSLSFFTQPAYRQPQIPAAEAPGQVLLTESQRAAYEKLSALLEADAPATALLFGITGSGKTEVYIRLIEAAIARGRQVIQLVPEIALTPQVIAQFTARFGDQVAILHSALSLGERLDEWKRIREGKVSIAVGTRSAVFAPFDKLGLIILDEEQEYTYKSESAPRFHARDVARYRGRMGRFPVVLGSATPSVESYYLATKGEYMLVSLSERYGGAVLPAVEMVDMQREAMEGNTSLFSRALLGALADNLAAGGQSILLLNRRGYYTKVICTQCGQAVRCPHCSIAMTYHAASGRLLCHYCGHSQTLEDRCPACTGELERFTGAGTQMVEEQLAEYLPEARILRVDADTTMNKNAHSEKFEAFGRGDYDIMVGTQMVAKGLHFPSVTLVGVLAADAGLFGDDYRSGERTFSLVTQVVGRSGRGRDPGRAIIQTHLPDNRVLLLAAAQDYAQFFDEELSVRRVMLYPPFCSFWMAGFSGEEESQVLAAAGRFLEDLTTTAIREYPGLPLRVLGITPFAVVRVGGRFRYKILIKCGASQQQRQLMRQVLVRFGRAPENREVAAFIDTHFDGSF